MGPSAHTWLAPSWLGGAGTLGKYNTFINLLSFCVCVKRTGEGPSWVSAFVSLCPDFQSVDLTNEPGRRVNMPQESYLYLQSWIRVLHSLLILPDECFTNGTIFLALFKTKTNRVGAGFSV